MVADLDARHLWANGFDNPGRLVAENHRQSVLPLTLDDVVIAVTHACRTNPHQYLAGTWRVDLYVLQFEWLTVVVEYRCLHEVYRTSNVKQPSGAIHGPCGMPGGRHAYVPFGKVWLSVRSCSAPSMMYTSSQKECT